MYVVPPHPGRQDRQWPSRALGSGLRFVSGGTARTRTRWPGAEPRYLLQAVPTESSTVTSVMATASASSSQLLARTATSRNRLPSKSAGVPWSLAPPELEMAVGGWIGSNGRDATP